MDKVDVLIEELEYPPEGLEVLKALKAFGYNFFLDSSCDHERLGRFSFLGCDPFLVFKSKRDFVTLEWADGRKETFASNPFLALKEIFGRFDIVKGSHEIPFTAGAVGYFAYDLKDFVEKLPDTACDDLSLPDCILAFYDTAIIYDNLKGKVYISSSGLPETEPVKNNARKISRLKWFKKNISAGAGDPSPYTAAGKFSLESNFSRQSYKLAVLRAKEYIKKGDIYQVNLSQRFHTGLNMDPLRLYERLRSASPAPFSSFLDFKDVTVLSSSPERFLLKKGRYIETRPIKGTRPRGKDEADDLELARELAGSPKDRAEHIMIVDLERNDLGRICVYGSVRPSESFALEKYSNVFHLVSTVAGRLKEDVGPVDCLMAAFPGGSITGAPKIRSMEIIEELEPVKRSIYTGAIGYISFDGNMDTSVVIRTFLVKGRDVYFQVGGGIVADSDPEAEYEETLHKAKGLMEALGCKIFPPTSAVTFGRAPSLVANRH